ncbi:MAG: 4Fe-4S dicluster domain-containing protein [Acidobacteria bacterium]|nr:4Fe-4S dicluster domain-containing protein [Acidobacteriota bacterium]
MAYAITDECTACGACPQVCPNDAILGVAPVFRINPWDCTECVGFADAPHCAAVCPAGAIVLAGEREIICRKH